MPSRSGPFLSSTFSDEISHCCLQMYCCVYMDARPPSQMPLPFFPLLWGPRRIVCFCVSYLELLVFANTGLLLSHLYTTNRRNKVIRRCPFLPWFRKTPFTLAPEERKLPWPALGISEGKPPWDQRADQHSTEVPVDATYTVHKTVALLV